MYQRQITKHLSHFINLFLFVFAGVLLCTQVYISNRIATSGKTMSLLEQRAYEIEDQNRALLSQSVEDLSLQKLSQKATKLGFIPASEMIQIGNIENASLALNR